MPRIIDWKRIESSIKQRFRREPRVRIRIAQAMELLKKMVPHLGDQSTSRRALRNIGTSLITNMSRVRIISPICLSVPSGALHATQPSELVKKHVAFLESFGSDMPSWKLACLFPPPEREDADAESYIRDMCELTRIHYAHDPRVSVQMMTEYAPGMIALEESVIDEIHASPFLLAMSGRMTAQRTEYYRDISIPTELWARRTRRTMAQYIILGRIAALEGALMCNHTTANIKSALYAGGGVLHNPVGFR